MKNTRAISQLGAYLLIVLIGFLGFFRVESLNHRFDNEARARSVSNCESVVRSNAVLRAIIDRSTVEATPPDGASPSLIQAYEDGNRRAKEFVDFAHKLLVDPDCAKLADGKVP